MFEIITIVTCVITLIILKFCLNINFRKMKKFKISGLEELEKVSNKFPTDKEMCTSILNKLNVKNIKIKEQPEYENCIYTIFNNTITIGKFKEDYMKSQTIAHECIHASQNKRMLWSNFIFTNLYLIYFIVILVLTLFNKLPNTNVFLIILVFAGIIQYILRFTLENEAMIKARYLSKEYIEENKLLNKSDKENLFKEFDRVNNIGIPFINYYLISMNIIKIMLYSFIALA